MYSIGVAKETPSVPATLQNMMDTFNHLNITIQALLMNAEEVASNVSPTPHNCVPYFNNEIQTAPKLRYAKFHSRD